MLPKQYRLAHRPSLVAVLRRGERISGGGLSLRVIRTGRAVSRFAFVVPNSVSKKATRRNRLRRQLREFIRMSLPQLHGGYDVVVAVHPAAAASTAPALAAAIRGCLRRARLYTT